MALEETWKGLQLIRKNPEPLGLHKGSGCVFFFFFLTIKGYLVRFLENCTFSSGKGKRHSAVGNCDGDF